MCYACCGRITKVIGMTSTISLLRLELQCVSVLEWPLLNFINSKIFCLMGLCIVLRTFE
jgi:hypothetical protein